MARRGTDNITVRMNETLWSRFGEVTPDRSALIRAFVEWYVREPGAKLPRRPESVTRTDEGDHDPSRSDSAA